MGIGAGGGFSRVSRVEASWNLREYCRERILAECGKTRVTEKFLWIPIRCPKTHRWFWLRNVKLNEESYYRLADMGDFLWPSMRWKTTSVVQ